MWLRRFVDRHSQAAGRSRRQGIPGSRFDDPAVFHDVDMIRPTAADKRWVINSVVTCPQAARRRRMPFVLEIERARRLVHHEQLRRLVACER